MVTRRNFYCALIVTLLLAGCTRSRPEKTPLRPAASGGKRVSPVAARAVRRSRMVLDFEAANPAVEVAGRLPTGGRKSGRLRGPVGRWPHDHPPHGIHRSRRKPHGGKWCLRAAVAGPRVLSHGFTVAQNFQEWDTFTAYVRESSGVQDTGLIRARVFAQDAARHIYRGEAYPVHSRWRPVTLNLRAAARAGLNVAAIRRVGLILHTVQNPSPVLAAETDDWQCRRTLVAYTGHRYGLPGNFYVQQQGGVLSVGVVRRFRIQFVRRGLGQRPWMRIAQAGAGNVVGAKATGLYLLRQSAFDRLGRAVRQDVPRAARGGLAGNGNLRRRVAGEAFRAPGPRGVARWKLLWASPVAALVRVRQSCGPYDALGRPARVVHWQFMVYRSGQVFGRVGWKQSPSAHLPRPMSLALAMPAQTFHARPEPRQLLALLYPRAMQAYPLPNAIQLGAPLGLAGRWGTPRERIYWRARAGNRRIVGIGLPRGTRNGPLHFLLLAARSNQLQKAAYFSQFIHPPRVRLRLGRLVRNYPGDKNGSTLVAPLGFQVVRLREGRAIFSVVPGSRPLFYPTFLLLPGSPKSVHGLVANVAGQEFRHLPRFGGGALLEIPYPLARPLHVEVQTLASPAR